MFVFTQTGLDVLLSVLPDRFAQLLHHLWRRLLETNAERESRDCLTDIADVFTPLNVQFLSEIVNRLFKVHTSKKTA